MRKDAHSLSSEFGASYSLETERMAHGMKLSCRDRGSRNPFPSGPLIPNREALDLESGRGLAMVNALSATWGDNEQPRNRDVWFFLAYDLSESRWNTL